MADERVWVIATGNPGKRCEIEAILSHCDVSVRGLSPDESVAFPDEGTDYRENAIEKARAVAAQLGVIGVADDSGIEVDALDGAPGPLSARYGGEGLDDRGRVDKLLAALAGTEGDARGAKFVCHAALVTPEGETVVAYGECRGVILAAPRGRGGFGYDPVFQPEGFDRSMAEVDTATKHQISHRGRAFRDLEARVRAELGAAV
ncbi:MAG: RdgB/HAM1 family non-canonical purine NTP pyrophosphatase [Myxococcota bacterium]|nr:RdgB/HAM1 family non-canonical purine NTP pyrophosphatase [Myxococcota bacterium]